MKILIGVTATILAICSAQAECITELPKHRTGHWKYRYEEGQKCWFGPKMEGQAQRVATDLPSLRHRHRESTSGSAPVPVPSISKDIEEEVREPEIFEARRVKTFVVTKPPSVSRRLEDTFEEMARRCEVRIEACRDFK
jgi:hypothetical protein